MPTCHFGPSPARTTTHGAPSLGVTFLGASNRGIHALPLCMTHAFSTRRPAGKGLRSAVQIRKDADMGDPLGPHSMKPRLSDASKLTFLPAIISSLGTWATSSGGDSITGGGLLRSSAVSLQKCT